MTAFVAMNQSLSQTKYQNIYILWGLHFSSFPKPSEKSDAKIFRALVATYFKWWEGIQTSVDPEVKRNGIKIVKFLFEEIGRNFSPERLNEIRNFNPNAIDDLERSLPAISEDDFSRGVTEIVVESQEPDAGDKPE